MRATSPAGTSIIRAIEPASGSGYIQMASDVIYLDAPTEVGAPGVADALTVYGGLNVGDALGASAGQIRTRMNTAGTTDVVNLMELYRNTSGTAGNNIGGQVPIFVEDSGGTPRGAAILRGQLTTAAAATWVGRATLYAADYNNAGREILRGEGTGSAAAIGFLGAAAITRPTVTGSRGGNAALASALTALANLGLITDSTTA